MIANDNEPFIVVFYSVDGYETGTLGPFDAEQSAIDAVMEAYDYAKNNGIAWYPTETIPLRVYESDTV